MQRTDWLERQLEQLARALAQVAGAEATETELDTQLQGLVGMPLDVLRALPPQAVVRLIGSRFGDDQPARLYSALRLVEHAGDELSAHRAALRQAVRDRVGDAGLADMDRALAEDT